MSKYKAWFSRITALIVLAITVCVSFGACSNADTIDDVQTDTTQEISSTEPTYDHFYLEALRDKIGYIIDKERLEAMDIPETAKKTLRTINMVYVDEEKNKVVVGMKNLNDKGIALFKVYVTDSDAIEFTKHNGAIAS